MPPFLSRSLPLANNKRLNGVGQSISPFFFFSLLLDVNVQHVWHSRNHARILEGSHKDLFILERRIKCLCCCFVCCCCTETENGCELYVILCYFSRWGVETLRGKHHLQHSRVGNSKCVTNDLLVFLRSCNNWGSLLTRYLHHRVRR